MKFRAPTARLKGRVRYSFLDENDQPTYAHDQHGNRIWGGHWNSNLITDAGMDAVATDRLRTYPGAVDTLPQQWRAVGHIGTGSTTPTNADTVLDAEVMTSSSNGGFADESVYNSPSGGFITAEFIITRVFELASSQNLAEYGFSDDGGTLHIRELFRDESENPITISIAGGKKLRLDHALEIALPWGAASEAFDIEEYDAGDSLVNTHEMTADCMFVAESASNYAATFLTALPYLGSFGATKQLGVYTAPPSTDPTVAASNVGNLSVSQDEYTPGSYTVRQYATLPETGPNGTLYGYVLKIISLTGQAHGGSQGFRVAFNTPASFEKAETHTLELSVELSWARG